MPMKSKDAPGTDAGSIIALRGAIEVALIEFYRTYEDDDRMPGWVVHVEQTLIDTDDKSEPWSE